MIATRTYRHRIAFFCAPLILFSAPVHSAPTSTTTPPTQEFSLRYAEVSNLLEKQHRQAKNWEYGWGAFNGSALIYSTAQAFTQSNARERNGSIVQAVASLGGLADVVLRPLPAYHADIVCNDTNDLSQCLAAKEALLQSSAERASTTYDALPHLANAGVNATMGIVISQIGRTNDALISSISGVIIGEIQLWTMPAQPLHDFSVYNLRFAPAITQTDRAIGPTNSVEKPVIGIGASWKF